MACEGLRFGDDGPGVLLLHGFTGHPEDLGGFGAALGRAGYRAYAPCLAGHGGTPEDLGRTGADDWRRSAELALLELVEQRAGRGVAVCGLSLGGMLAIDLASRFPVRALVALNPAVAVRNRLAPLSRYVWRFVPYVRLRPQDNLERLPLRAVAELVGYIREARAAAGRVQAPSLVLQSEFDPLVRPEASREIYRLLGSREKEFEMLSSHEHVPRQDAAGFESRVIAFLNRAFEAER